MLRTSVIDRGALVGEIVKFFPATLEVFARHNLDLCCEAGYSLETAACEHKLDLGRLLQELNEAIRADEVRTSTGHRDSNPAVSARPRALPPSSSAKRWTGRQS